MKEVKAKDGVHGTQLTTLSLPNAATANNEIHSSTILRSAIKLKSKRLVNHSCGYRPTYVTE